MSATRPSMPPEEATLVERLRAGDSQAYEQLVREHGGRMYAVTLRLLGQESDARDALQEAFVSAFKGLANFDGNSRLATWLHRVAVNAALMRLRSRRRRPEQSIDALLPAFKPDGHAARPTQPWAVSPEDALERDELRELVRGKIHELPDPYRDVLLLRDIEELDTTEAAEALGISPGAVKTRLHRARQALRELLDPHLRGGDAP